MPPEKNFIHVPGTSIQLEVLPHKEGTTTRIIAQLMSRTETNSGLNFQEANILLTSLIEHKNDIRSSLIGVVTRKKSIHPSEAAQWLMESGNNKLMAVVWQNDEKGIIPPDHTV